MSAYMDEAEWVRSICRGYAERIAQLECENAELRKDKERLDLLASRYWAVPVTKEYTDHIWMIDHDTPDLRAAIDAARNEGGAS